MKTGTIFLILGIIIVIFLISLFRLLFGHITWGYSTFDIDFQNTKYVVSYWHALIPIFLLLGTFFFIGGTLGTRLKNWKFPVLLLLFIAGDAYFIFRITH